MLMTNDKIFSSVQVLSGLEEKGKLGYAIARNLRKLNDAGKEYFEKRDELIQKYGKPNADHNSFSFTEKNAKAFNKELEEYAEIEHEVDVMTVSEDVFCSGDMSSQAMYALEWMVATE